MKLKMKNNLNTTLALASVFGLLFGCSHKPTVRDFSATSSPTEEVAKFDSKMKDAMEKQVNVLAPDNFVEAKDSLAASKSSLESKNDAKVTLHEIAVGRAYLKRANEMARKSRNVLKEVISARNRAISANSHKLQTAEFNAADETFTDITADIEKNDLKDAIEMRNSLQLKYLDLELQAIKITRLGSARETIEVARNEGASEYAPRSLAIAEKSVQDTDAFITSNRHASALLSMRENESKMHATHLLKITRASKSGNRTSNEEQALKLESEQIKVSVKAEQLNEKKDQIKNKNAQIKQGQNANLALAVENSNLEDDKKFNERFEAARREFTTEEAEVYKQGNTLMIRLRGLEFSVAQSTLKGSNFPLLAKVQKVIKDFGNSTVIIEGHTDSNGGKALNERLSTQRAEAVKDYLTSNAGSEPLNITSVGFGYEKPLATNKTSSGRAQNRRVDVLVQAEST